jgi:hypothetical protein
MKRFWLVLLSLGLIVAFSTSAMAVDVKFSGEYYAAGLYLDKTTVVKDTSATYGTYSVVALPAPVPLGPGVTSYSIFVPKNNNYTQNQSSAFYFQRLRLKTEFIVSPGLTLTTRADIMERAWGAARSSSTVTTTTTDTNGFVKTVSSGSAPMDTLSAGTRAENENIAFDLAYVTYISPIGAFIAGYQIDGAWGTTFGDSSQPTPRLTYLLPIGNFQFSVMMGKATPTIAENSRTAINSLVTTTDLDSDFYTAFVKYFWKSGEVGFLAKYFNERSHRMDNTLANTGIFNGTGYFGVTVPSNYTQKNLVLSPYFKAKLGPVAVQGQIYYAQGKIIADGANSALTFITGYTEDQVKIQSLSGWVDATADFGMFYAGGSVAYISGDDPSSKDKNEGALTGGLDWNPCLIMFNSDISYWSGSVTGYADGAKFSAAGGPMTNAWFFQGRAGVRPISKLDIMASVSYANAVVKPTTTWLYNDYGYEVDLTATYKITNNLSYMLGAGYLFTGKYFRGSYDGNSLSNDYMLINKLTLTF